MEKKPGDTVKRGDIIAEVETQKDLSKLRYSMKASLINSSFRKEQKFL
jgi:hypothetical protein